MIDSLRAAYDYIYPQNPLTGQRYLHLLPDNSDSLESIICNSQETQIKEAGGEWDHPYYRRIFERILEDLIPYTKHPCFQWKVTLVDNSESIEGSTLPGGKILVYRGLVELMGEIQSNKISEENRFAAIVAHETAHSAAYHGYRSASFFVYSALLQISYATVMLSTIGMSLPVFLSIGSLYSIHYLYSYSLARNDEFEADKYGIQIMSGAGYDPLAMLWIMIVFDIVRGKKSEDQNEYIKWIKSWFTTHPSPKERIKAIKSTLIELKDKKCAL